MSGSYKTTQLAGLFPLKWKDVGRPGEFKLCWCSKVKHDVPFSMSWIGAGKGILSSDPTEGQEGVKSKGKRTIPDT